MRTRTLIGGIVVVLSCCTAGWAATGTVTFNGEIEPTCTLNVTGDGTLKISTDLQSLSSKLSGGAAGTVTVQTTGGVTLSVVNGGVPDVPDENTTSTTWTPSYLASGAATISETNTHALDAPGEYDMLVHLVGTKGGTDRFAAGDYQATVTVNCE